MLTSVNPLERIAVGRLQEFLAERVPWHRSLWGVGVILAMDELAEACVARREGHLSEPAVLRMAGALQARIGKHPVFADTEKKFLQQQLKSVPRAGGVSHFGIRELSERVASDYLTRWGRAVTAGNFNVEHISRSVAAFLLDAGFSAQYLHGFIKARLEAPEDISLPQLCDALHAETLTSRRREFEVLLAFKTMPQTINGVPSTWLLEEAVTGWIEAHGFDTAGVRSPAAMVLKVQARDPVGAAQAARDEYDRYAARALIATGKSLQCLPFLWVKGSAAPAAMAVASRGVGVKELFREDRVFSPNSSQSVDAALELLAHLESSSPPAAIAGGWGAIEGLLADPNDRATAADNLATLVTCSFPRAELTALCYRYERNEGQPGRNRLTGGTNRERCHSLATMIMEGSMPTMHATADQAAVNRMRKLLRDPARGLKTIRESFCEAFHRLYRQRNLILHGGRLDSVALTASLRTVAKLAGAGMDRITHGRYVQNLSPLELVARANLALAIISQDSPLRCVDLLEGNV